MDRDEEVRKARQAGVTVGLLVGVSFGFFNAALIVWGISNYIRTTVFFTVDYSASLSMVVVALLLGGLQSLSLGLAFAGLRVFGKDSGGDDPGIVLQSL